jgi:hypothetical protein
MRSLKIICLLLVASAAPIAAAEVLQVNIYKPTPGNSAQTFANGQEARAIHQKLGGNVIIGADTEGRMHYVLTFENWAAWAKFSAKIDASKEATAFNQKIATNPSAELEDQYLLNVPSPGGVGAVYQVFIWEPLPGRAGQLIQSGMKAEAILEKSGADIAINVDQLNRMHFIVSFDNWDAWAKFSDTPNEEFQQFMATQGENPNGILVKVYLAESI